MNSPSEANPSDAPVDAGLTRLVDRLSKKLAQDAIVQQVTDRLRNALQVDRVVLYYFYSQWKGQVTFESLRSEEFSIFGMTGAEECFNDEYAEMYLKGRVKAIVNVDLEPIHDCHREFLDSIRVRANLVAPILTDRGLWGLLVAHHCSDTRPWLESEIATIGEEARFLAQASSIR